MSAEITRSSEAIALEINFIKRQTASVCLNSAIEIGKLLCEAKAALQHGEWGKWLEENVDYSVSTANNLMKLYSCYGQDKDGNVFDDNVSDIFGALTPSQALALTALPEDKRAEYVQTHDVENESVKEMKEQIKELQGKCDNLEKESKKKDKDIKGLKKQADDASERAEGYFKDLESANKRAELAEKNLKELSDKEVPDVESIRAEYVGEIENYKKRLELAESSDIQRFSIYFEMLQSNFNKCKGLLQKFDDETVKKLKDSLLKISRIFAEQLTD